MTNRFKPLKGCEILPPMPTLEETALDETLVEGVGAAIRPGDPSPKNKDHGRFAMLNAFVDRTLATVQRTDALVWLVLYRDVHGETAKTAQQYIADRAGLCKRTVYAAIKRLKRVGLVEVVYQGGLNRGLSVYRLRPLVQNPKQE